MEKYCCYTGSILYYKAIMGLGIASLIIGGISGLIGGVVGIASGEGFAKGFSSGFNWLGNVVDSVGHLTRGELPEAGLSLLGMSDAHMNAVKAGDRALWAGLDIRSIAEHNLAERGIYQQAESYTEKGLEWILARNAAVGDMMFFGLPEYRNDQFYQEIGNDLIFGTLTIGGGFALEKFGGKLISMLSSGALWYQAGRSFDDLTDSINNVGADLLGYQVLGVTGDPNRFELGTEDVMIPVEGGVITMDQLADLYEQYEDELVELIEPVDE
jgi:hypothetical protein